MISRSVQQFFGSSINVRLISGSNVTLGVVVSKKVGDAVERNYQKRRIRSAFRDLYNSGSLKHGIFIIVAKKEIAQTDFKALKNQIEAGAKYLTK
jgi:ribonuclease P protein component